MTDADIIINEVLTIKQKYIDAELKHYRKFQQKNTKLRSKVSVLDELINNIKLTIKNK